MRTWMRRLKAAVVMGLVWGIAWAVIGGTLMEGIFDRDGRIMDMWPQLLAITGFLGGAFFSIVLGIAAHAKKFSELSTNRFTAFGAGAGVLLGAFLMTTGAGPLVFLVMIALC